MGSLFIRWIEGAIGPTCTVALGDVGTYLGIEVVPMDKNERQGKCFKYLTNVGKELK